MNAKLKNFFGQMYRREVSAPVTAVILGSAISTPFAVLDYSFHHHGETGALVKIVIIGIVVIAIFAYLDYRFPRRRQ